MLITTLRRPETGNKSCLDSLPWY